jgi:hypothetical protein
MTSLLGFIWVQNRWIGDIKFIQHHIMLIYANSMILIGKYGTIFGTEYFFFSINEWEIIKQGQDG